ncbi:N/A [soil metagenome]|uniref:LuxR C-terminal-related transcriptional regulator n=1 Tax=Sphingobium sp. BS19 TaxID=3018973 RepID=UPI00248F5203|nr:response regulator transcription factor [Sphingobium sp. BS19]
MSNKIKISIINQNEIEGEGLRRILIERSVEDVEVFRKYSEISFDDMEGPMSSVFLLICSPVDDMTLDICRMAHEAHPEARIIMLANECSSMMVARAFRVGVAGYISKDTSCAGLVAMIKLVELGEKVIPSRVISDLAALDTTSRPIENDVRISDTNMSGREIEILRGLIRGEPNKLISRRLNITEATVKVHVKSILRKLQVVNRTQAAIWAMSRGLSGNSETSMQEEIALPFPVLTGTRPPSVKCNGTYIAAA